MKLLGNILWILLGGFVLAIEYMVAGVILCLTIVGIPFGYQVFRLGMLALLPFGKTTVVTKSDYSGFVFTFMNILWLLIGGIWIALTHLIFGVIFCITIIGIPFGLQHFKLMSMALTPFGRTIVNTPIKPIQQARHAQHMQHKQQTHHAQHTHHASHAHSKASAAHPAHKPSGNN